MSTTLSGEITNECTCTVYDEITNEFTDEPAEHCDGYCWEFAIDDFANVTEELRNANETEWWKVIDLRLWHGTVSGYFHADTALKLLEGMTVRSAWIMRYEVFHNRIEYSLSHHDAMGSNTTLVPVTEEEREELGLY